MKLGHVEIPSIDPQQTADYYRDHLGFSIEAVQAGRFFWLARDGFSFLIRPRKSAEDAHNLVFYSSAADEEARKVKEAGIEVRWGTDQCHHFKDPNGHCLQIVDPGQDHSG